MISSVPAGGSNAAVARQDSRARPFWALGFVISVVLLVPCFWHRHIEAGDLGSHLYNAWLAQLVAKGQAPGLYIVPQWNNVLFDLSLYHAANWFGFAVAEKLVVSLCMLVFFWGVFAFVAAISERRPWELIPCVAMLSYGYAFHMGFMNFYLSAGLACLALAFLWPAGTKRSRSRWVTAGVLALLTITAHPLGFAWLLGVAGYIFLWRSCPYRWRLLLPLLAAAMLLGAGFVIWRNPHSLAAHPAHSFYFYNGADQLILFGDRYAYVAWGALAWGIACLAIAIWRNRRAASAFWIRLRLPLELYVLALFAAKVLPEDFHLSEYAGWIGLFVSRLSVFTAIFALCILAASRLGRIAAAGFALCVIVFFSFLYQDTRALARLEAQARSIAEQLSYGTRVIPTIYAPPGWRIEFIYHAADRACIGRCFVYSNYEPSTSEFRMRARPGSPIVTASSEDSEDMQGGDYEVQPEDLPLTQIYQCDAKLFTKLCVRQYEAGELTGVFAQRPED